MLLLRGKLPCFMPELSNFARGSRWPENERPTTQIRLDREAVVIDPPRGQRANATKRKEETIERVHAAEREAMKKEKSKPVIFARGGKIRRHSGLFTSCTVSYRPKRAIQKRLLRRCSRTALPPLGPFLVPFLGLFPFGWPCFAFSRFFRLSGVLSCC